MFFTVSPKIEVPAGKEKDVFTAVHVSVRYAHNEIGNELMTVLVYASNSRDL